MSIPGKFSDKLTSSYATKTYTVGLPSAELVETYSAWAETYDKELANARYNGPKIAATALAEYYDEKERKEVKVIDVAAGTGKVGEELHSLGFTRVDALEPAEGMLAIAKQRNVYNKLICETIGDKRTSIPDDTYDCLVISGGMGEGHIPTIGLNEMIRVVKPGGLICIAMYKKYLSTVTDYAGKLEPYMKELQEKKLWREISRTEVPNYFCENEGLVFKFNVL